MQRPDKPELLELTESIDSEVVPDDEPVGILQICTKALMPVTEPESNLKQYRLMATSMLEAFERDEDFALEVDDRVLN